MYFNVWSDTNYVIKVIIIASIILIISYLVIIILINFYKKMLLNFKTKKNISKIIERYNSLDNDRKKTYLIKKLNLNSTYLIASFIGKNEEYINKLIRQKDYNKINSLILKKLLWK